MGRLGNTVLNIELKPKKRENVKIFWEHSRDPQLKKLFPFEDISLDEAYAIFDKHLSDESSYFERSIYVNGGYVGDIWCYSIDEKNKEGYLSIVIFDKNYWNKGVGTEATKQFLKIVFEKYHLDSIKAYTYQSNIRSLKYCEKVGFTISKTFEKDGVTSHLLSLRKSDFLTLI